MSALPCSSWPSVSRRYAVTRAAPGRQRLEARPEELGEALLLAGVVEVPAQGEHPVDVRRLGGVSRQACAARSIASRVAPRAAARAAAASRPVASSSSGTVVASARWRARRCSSATTSASPRWSSRCSSSAAWRLAAAARSGWAARTRSPSTVTTPAATAASRAAGLARSPSWPTRRSGCRAMASSTRRAGSSRSATRSPSRSSTSSGTGRSSPRVSRSRPASIRPTSIANSGLPIVVSYTRRSRWCGRRSPSRAARICRVAPRLMAPTSTRTSCSSGNAFSTAVRRPGRRASRNVTGSACSRRAAYAIASSDALSSHWRSSIATRMRSPSLSARSAESTAREITWASGGRSVGSAR